MRYSKLIFIAICYVILLYQVYLETGTYTCIALAFLIMIVLMNNAVTRQSTRNNQELTSMVSKLCDSLNNMVRNL